MDIPVKTLKSGFALPVYGLGTWEIGGRWSADHANDEQGLNAIRLAIEHGITHIDTAESYAAGHAEELVGQAIKGFDRGKMIITTKVSGHNQGHDNLLKSFEASLKRLDTDYVDLYLLHRFPNAGIDISGTMRAMDRLVNEGVVKNIGVCNMTVNRLQETQKHTSNKIVCNQIHYSVRVREAEKRGVIDYCQQNDILITAWGPLEKGLLKSGMLEALAKKYGKTPYQVALNWLISQPNVVTIPKTTNIEHLEENLGSLGWELSADDEKRLRLEFPYQRDTSPRVPLDYKTDVEP